MISNEKNYKHSEVTEKFIGEIYHVHNVLGSGFLEKVYENALKQRLIGVGFSVEQQMPINVIFEEDVVGEYFADLLVDEKVVLELKAMERLEKIHEVQLVNFLKATDMEVGLLVNFGKSVEIKRKVLTINS